MYQRLVDALISLDARVCQIEDALAGSSGDPIEQLFRRPPQPGDPAATDRVRAAQLEALLLRRPIVDPAVTSRRPIVDPAVTSRRPIVDPAVTDRVRAQLQELILANPGWFTDPVPEDILNVRLLDLIRRFRGGFADPPPNDLTNVRLKDLLQVPGGGFTDPNPEDIPRLTAAELESQRHKINAEKVRLESLDRMIGQRLAEIGGGAAKAEK